jgi:hypothetical protein
MLAPPRHGRRESGLYRGTATLTTGFASAPVIAYLLTQGALRFRRRYCGSATRLAATTISGGSANSTTSIAT